MKLTKREIIMLILLGGVLLIFSSYKFLIKPQLDKISALKDRKLQLEETVARSRLELASYEKIKDNLEMRSSQIDEATVSYFPNIKQEKIITVLDDMLGKAQVEGKNIDFNQIELTVIEEVKETEEEGNYALKEIVKEYNDLVNEEVAAKEEKEEDKEKDKIDVANLERMTATIKFSGSYSNLLNLLTRFEAYNKKLIIGGLDISNEDTQLVGDIILDFYSIPKLLENKTDNEFLMWNLNNSYGKEDPFGN